ncbi:hypothetical protein C3L33_05484, partial [Rhododendron williamsianum]
MQKAVSKFSGFVDQVEWKNQSGLGDADKMKEAMDMHYPLISSAIAELLVIGWHRVAVINEVLLIELHTDVFFDVILIPRPLYLFCSDVDGRGGIVQGAGGGQEGQGEDNRVAEVEDTSIPWISMGGVIYAENNLVYEVTPSDSLTFNSYSATMLQELASKGVENSAFPSCTVHQGLCQLDLSLSPGELVICIATVTNRADPSWSSVTLCSNPKNTKIDMVNSGDGQVVDPSTKQVIARACDKVHFQNPKINQTDCCILVLLVNYSYAPPTDVDTQLRLDTDHGQSQYAFCFQQFDSVVQNISLALQS